MVALVGSIGLRDDGTLKIVPAVLLPQINVTATDATATEAGTTTGQFTITSDQAAGAGGLAIAFSLSGTATITTDYTIDASPAIITPGNTSVLVTVTPVDDLDIEIDETVIVTIQPDADYTVGGSNAATVTIESEDPPHEYDPVNLSTSVLLSNTNLTTTGIGSSWGIAKSLFGRILGKWYAEVRIDAVVANDSIIGIVQASTPLEQYLGQSATAYGYYGSNGLGTHAGNLSLPYAAPAYGIGDIVGVHFDGDSNTLAYSVNGVYYGILHSSLPAVEFFLGISHKGANSATTNFGVSDFVYPLPTGYLAWDSSADSVGIVLDSNISEGALSNNNLTLTNVNGPYDTAISNKFRNSGLHYFELTYDVASSDGIGVGISTSQILATFGGGAVDDIVFWFGNFGIYHAGSIVESTTLPNTAGQTVGILWDASTGTLSVYNVATDSLLSTYTDAAKIGSEVWGIITTKTSQVATVNFGASAFQLSTLPVGYLSWDGSQAG
jgi:hypothetical protein